MKLRNKTRGGEALKKIPANLHPFVFILDSLLFFYMRVKLEVPPGEILRPVLVLWALALILYPLARKLVGSAAWGSILLTILVFGFCFQENYFVIVGVAVAAAILLLFACFRLMRRRFRVLYLSLFLTATGFVLLAVETALLIGWFQSIPASYYAALLARQKSAVVSLVEPASGIKPDIYYIVLDSYAGADVLKDLYGYDNSAFLDFLKDEGFIVPARVLSNYPRTALSVSSTLDMQYWDTISPGMEHVAYWWPAKPVMNHSIVRSSLEAIGYESISIATDWQLANNTTTDHYFKPYPVILTEYEDFFISSTGLKLLQAPFQAVAPVRTSASHRRFVLYALETLEKIPEMPGPKFVFAHVILPHPPFIFEADGTPIESKSSFTFGTPAGFTQEGYRQSYVAQVQYLNARLRTVIETILEKSATPPIILLQADHGPALWVHFDPTDPGCLNERFSTFGAYYLPGRGAEVIPPDMTSVNLFRIVFNEYFGTDLDLMENREYLTKGTNMFAGMQEVTQQVTNTCTIPLTDK